MLGLLALTPGRAPADPGRAPFTIGLQARNHAPRANRRWPVVLTVTRGNQKLWGTVRFQFLFEGTVVGTRPTRGAFAFKHGLYADTLVFPRQAIGQPLIIRFVVATRYGTEHVDWAVTTRR